MGWLFSIATLIVGLKLNNNALLIAAGLYSIAGAIALKPINNTPNQRDTNNLDAKNT